MLGILLSIGVVSLLILALIWSGIRVNRENNTLHEVMIETAKATSLVFIILLGAAMLTAAFRAFGGEELVRDYLNSLPGGFWTKFIIVMAVIFVLGFFLDFIEIAVVVVPIVAPILLADPSANITAVWLGVMIGLNIQTSFLTPPFGFALFYLRGVAPAVVKTINMYKGVIAFICLQLIALGIVGYYPQLVNYLPNRMSLLSETAPPPRNPMLQYCIEEYTTEQFASNSTFDSAISNASALDLSLLPKKMADDLSKSFDNATDAKRLLAEANAAEKAVIENQESYRVFHTQVRDIEMRIRDLDATAKELDTQRNRVSGDNAEQRIVAINEQLAAIEASKADLNSQIPEEWEAENKKHVELQNTETKARLAYRRAADGGYSPAVTVSATLAGTSALRELEASLPEMRARVENDAPADLLDPLKALSDQFGEIEGASKIKSAVSKARSSLKKKKPNQEAAIKAMDNAIELFAEDMEWRNLAEPAIGNQLVTYENEMRGTIGIRQQERLTRDQALFVASCNAGHRDISLNF